MKNFIAAPVALAATALVSPAIAYVVEVTTSIDLTDVADKAQLRQAVESAVEDVVANAISFSPTVITVQNARVVGDRMYLLLLIVDAAGEKVLKAIAGEEAAWRNFEGAVDPGKHALIGARSGNDDDISIVDRAPAGVHRLFLSTAIAYAAEDTHHAVDVDRWDSGRWLHGDHLGRVGWWWAVGDGWYFYPSPVYPYPDRTKRHPVEPITLEIHRTTMKYGRKYGGRNQTRRVSFVALRHENHQANTNFVARPQNYPCCVANFVACCHGRAPAAM